MTILIEQSAPTFTANLQDTLYDRIIQRLFLKFYLPGMSELPFTRQDVEDAARLESIDTSGWRNLGDIIYTYRHNRRPMPCVIADTSPDKEWTIHGTKKSHYKFCLVSVSKFRASVGLPVIAIPNRSVSQIPTFRRDEQVILSMIRCNDLLSLFLSCRLDHLQSHLRMTVADLGQIEIDDVYTGIDGKTGISVIVPVQAKGKDDPLSSVQVSQDVRAFRQRYPDKLIRSVGVILLDDIIVCMEFTVNDLEVSLINEVHYSLV